MAELRRHPQSSEGAGPQRALVARRPGGHLALAAVVGAEHVRVAVRAGDSRCTRQRDPGLVLLVARQSSSHRALASDHLAQVAAGAMEAVLAVAKAELQAAGIAGAQALAELRAARVGQKQAATTVPWRRAQQLAPGLAPFVTDKRLRI